MNRKDETMTSLERTAPGLFQALRRAFAPLVVAELGKIYGGAVEIAGLEATSIPREPGVSFNPRPARIARILLSEGGTSAETIGAALGSLIGTEALPASPLVDRETVAQVQAAFTSPETRLSVEGEGIVLAFILDEVRHLHMSNLDEAARGAAIERARQRVERTRSIERWSRLRTLVRHALSRWNS